LSAAVTFPGPTISLAYPAENGIYAIGEVGGAPSYSCTPALGTTLVSCTDSLTAFSLSLPSSFGMHSFVVSALDDDGGSTSETVTYYVDSAPELPVLPHPLPTVPVPALGVPVGALPDATTGEVSIGALHRSSARWRTAANLPSELQGSPPGAAAPGGRHQLLVHDNGARVAALQLPPTGARPPKGLTLPRTDRGQPGPPGMHPTRISRGVHDRGRASRPQLRDLRRAGF